MKISKSILAVATMLLIAGPVSAQSEEDEAGLDEKREMMQAQKREYRERLREAERRMEMAAREIAELTGERLPQLVEIERNVEFMKRPRIGITIDGDEGGKPVEGVEINGVTPGTAADDAGLRAGDLLTSINGEPLSAENSMKANKLLLEFMSGVEEGDMLTIEYLRNGNVATIDLQPRVQESHSFAWFSEPGQFSVPHIEVAPEVADRVKLAFGFPLAGSAWSNMELVELSEGLGRYFGTVTGLLVVSAPEVDGLQLQDGDVIQSIDGREPTDVRHALRILSSYDEGEQLEIGIMRDKKKRKLDVEIPADRRGFIPVPPQPDAAPLPALPPLPDESRS